MLIQYEHGDPGGKAALLPVLGLLRQDDNLVARWNTGDILPNADIVITSTSDGIHAEEKLLTHKAKMKGVPTLSVLDFWSQYRQRYANASDELVYLPDKIAVMDEYAKAEMILRGFHPDILEVTGHPAFDCLADKRALWDRRPLSRYHVWRGHGVNPDKTLVVFGSQPLSKLGYGFNEHQVIRQLIHALEGVGDIHLILRPHPREDIADFYQYERFDNPRVEIKRKGDVHDLCMAADLVIGMNSVLLVEACYLGCIVLSIQPGKVGPDRLPTNRLGFSYPLYETEFTREMVAMLLYDEERRQKTRDNLKRFKIQEKAAPKVVNLVYRMVT